MGSSKSSLKNAKKFKRKNFEDIDDEVPPSRLDFGQTIIQEDTNENLITDRSKSMLVTVPVIKLPIKAAPKRGELNASFMSKRTESQRRHVKQIGDNVQRIASLGRTSSTGFNN